MYSKADAQLIKKEFWSTFGNEYPRKWLLYNTKIKDVTFKFNVDNKKAFVMLDIEPKDENKRKIYFEKVESLKDILIEAIAMKKHPFIIYIDDENEIISNIYGKTVFDTNIKKEFYFELCSYNETEPYNENKSYKKIEMSSITEDMKKDPKNLNSW